MMFSQSLRRALLKPPAALSLRTLSTAVSPPTVASNEAPSIFEQEHDITDSVINRWWGNEPLTVSERKLYNLSLPAFISMSSLINEPGSSRTRNQVVALAPSVFQHPIRRDILHLCVVHHLDGIRQGTAANKSRGEVRGSGAKIRKQKGSGRARLGDAQSPMLRGGGRTFAKKARDFSTKLPRKVIQMGMRVALSAKLKEHGLGVVESLRWPGVKTKDFATRIKELGWTKTLFVTGLAKVPETLRRSSSNVQGVDVMTARELTVYEAVKWERLVLDVSAVCFFEETLGKLEVDRIAFPGGNGLLSAISNIEAMSKYNSECSR